MSNTNTGGPAFPQDYEHTKVLVQMQQTGDISAKDLQKLSKQLAGMTMLDYFAAKAMQGELSAMTASDWASFAGLSLEISDSELDRLAQHWFRIGRAMLKAREQ